MEVPRYLSPRIVGKVGMLPVWAFSIASILLLGTFTLNAVRANYAKQLLEQERAKAYHAVKVESVEGQPNGPYAIYDVEGVEIYSERGSELYRLIMRADSLKKVIDTFYMLKTEGKWSLLYPYPDSSIKQVSLSEKEAEAIMNGAWGVKPHPLRVVHY